MASGYFKCESCDNKRYTVRAKATQMSPEEREPCKECNFNEWLTWANNYRGYASVKQLTIKELRDRFSMHMLSGGWHKDILLAIREDGSYDDFTVDMNWNTYKQCAIDCGILKQ